MPLDVNGFAAFARASAAVSTNAELVVSQMLVDIARTKLASPALAEVRLAKAVLADPQLWARTMSRAVVSTITQATPTEAQFLAGVTTAWADYVAADAAAVA